MAVALSVNYRILPDSTKSGDLKITIEAPDIHHNIIRT